MLDNSIKFKRGTTGLGIMTTYWEKAENPEQYASLEIFMDKVRAMLWRTNQVVIHYECLPTLESKCQSLVAILMHYEMIEFSS